jgi:hypothetical protein
MKNIARGGGGGSPEPGGCVGGTMA